MTHQAKTFRRAATVALAFAALSFQASGAFAVNNSVKSACKADYFAYCSAHAVGSSSLRRCMAKNGRRLSKRCVGALLKARMVPKSMMRRRSARR